MNNPVFSCLKKHKTLLLILLGWLILMLPAGLRIRQSASTDSQPVCFYVKPETGYLRDDFLLRFYDGLPEKDFYYFMVKDLPAKLHRQDAEQDVVVRLFAPCMCRNYIINMSNNLPIDRRLSIYLYMDLPGISPYVARFDEADDADAAEQLILGSSSYAVSVYRTPTLRDAAGTIQEAYFLAVSQGFFNDGQTVLFVDLKTYLQYASERCGKTVDDRSQLDYDGALIVLPDITYGKLRQSLNFFAQNGLSVQPSATSVAGMQRHYRGIAIYTVAVTAGYALFWFMRRRRRQAERTA